MHRLFVGAVMTGTLLFALTPSVYAQAPSAEPQASPAPPRVTTATPEPVVIPQPVRVTRSRPATRLGNRSRVHEDARHCLDYESDMDAMRCAEKYRY